MQRKLNLHYAAVNGIYWMYYGIIASFASAFLLWRGFGNAQIGFIAALGNLAAVLIQPFLANLADKDGRLSVFALTEILTLVLALLSTGLFFCHRADFLTAALFVSAFALTMIIQPFCNALYPKLEETGYIIRFGLCRGFGSFSYSVFMILLALLTAHFSMGILPLAGLSILLIFFYILRRTSDLYRQSMTRQKKDGGASGLGGRNAEVDFSAFVRRHRFFILSGAGVLGVFFSNAVLNIYMAQIVYNVGGTEGEIGYICSLFGFMELPALLLFDRLTRRFSTAGMIRFASLAFAVRMLVCLMARSMGVLVLATLVQPFSFALFLPAMVKFINEIMSVRESVRGQSFFTMTMTAAVIFAGLVGGLLIDRGGVRSLLLFATAVTLLGALLLFFTLGRAAREGGPRR